MRSDFDSFSALASTLARQAADPDNPRRLLAAQELERLARHHRAMMVGEALAEAIVWLVRLPARLLAALAKTTSASPPARRIRVRG